MNIIKMTAVLTLLGMMAFFYVSCASVQGSEQEDIHLQETKTFANCTFGEAWEAVIKSVNDIGFHVQKRMVKEGFIYAQGSEDPDSLYLPPHMNIYIRRGHEGINVRCHVVIPGDPSNYEITSEYVDSFFAALYKNLR
jgi:hypothetical protein